MIRVFEKKTKSFGKSDGEMTEVAKKKEWKQVGKGR